MAKTALVTGASRGIGAACARALAKDGYRVAINYLHSEEKAFVLAQELNGTAIKADVSSRGDVDAMFEISGGVDVLVCCAGIALFGLITDAAENEWRRVFAVNVGGVINCCQAALPHMIHQKSGSIITLSSMWGVTGASCETIYSSSKAAVIGLTKALAKELGPSGIRINCIAPGVIDTDMNANLSPDTFDELRDMTPLGRIGAPEDVASAVRFLASDEAAFITGQVIGVNGGIVI